MDEALSTPPLKRTWIDNSSLVINGELRSFESTASFSNILRTEGQAYFDRTRYISTIESFAEGGPVLFLRPRRFGKSLTVSMLEHFHGFRYANVHESFYKVCNHVLDFPDRQTYFSFDHYRVSTFKMISQKGRWSLDNTSYWSLTFLAATAAKILKMRNCIFWWP